MKRAPDNVRNPEQFGRHILTQSFTARDPTRTSTALTNGYQVVKSFRYLLTDPGQFDILQFGWQGSKCNSMN